jgi:cullin 3
MSSSGNNHPSSGSGAAPAARKKYSIRPFRQHQPMDNAAALRVWEQLERAMDEIYNRNASQLSFEELYRNAYNLVLHKHGQLLYEGVSHKISTHLSSVAEDVSSKPDASLLEAVSECWSDHTMTMVMIRDILMYMDRTYVMQSKKRPVYDLGLALFRDITWEHALIETRVTTLLLHNISQERDGQIIQQTLMKVILGMLLELGGGYSPQQQSHLGNMSTRQHRHALQAAAALQANASATANVYERDFEAIFLDTTQEFYRNESSSYLSQNTAPDYVRKAQARLAEEHARAQRYLAPTTEAPLINIVEMELVQKHAKTLVEMEQTGFMALLKDSENKMNELRNMYDLFVRVPTTVDFLREALASIVKTEGKALLQDQERGAAEPTAFVKGILAMRETYTTVVDEAFRSEKKTSKRLKESFEDVLNQDNRAANCLAIYVDELLRTGLKGYTESQSLMEEELKKVILVFRYLQDKDVFELYYKQFLAKRLLQNKSISEEAEKAMVSQLKAECGYQFTSKLEGMFNDMRISKDTRDAYKHHVKSSVGAAKSAHSHGVDIEVDVLTT